MASQVVSTFPASTATANRRELSAIHPKQLLERHQAGQPLELIDVRTPVEFREAHVTFARNIPLDRLDPEALRRDRKLPDGEPIYVICRSGTRGGMACEKLLAAGWTNIVNVEGGTLAADLAGLPIQRGKKAMSLERQVRITAGGLAFLGAALSLVHPYWIGLSAFIGAGLVFAGITDTCAMGTVLARMPWNQVPQDNSAA